VTTSLRTGYATLGNVQIAYQVAGTGSADVLYISTSIHPVDLLWDDPVAARGLRRLAAGNRLILCDGVGVGSSDPVPYTDMPALQAWADGIGCVLDAVGSERASMIGIAESGLAVLLYAASHPERVRSLVCWAPYARYQRAPDLPCGMPPERVDRYLDDFVAIVGTGGLVDFMAPSRAGDEWFRAWWAKGERLSTGRVYAGEILGVFLRSDVRALLDSVHAPTLLLRRTGDWHVRDGHAAAMAAAMPNARLVELPGVDHEWFSGDSDAVLDVVEEFLTGSRTTTPTNRSLATVLFTDIVSSTERATELGDARWTEALHAHDAIVARHVAGYRGEVVKFTGDGVLATFDGPARAIECARDLVGALHAIGLEIRAGLHTGEIERRGADIHGIAVHIAARVEGLAAPGEVFVSAAIPPLVLGSGLEFVDCGRHALKGSLGEWTVYRVVGR
jgi:class 3 adenylate cyclase